MRSWAKHGAFSARSRLATVIYYVVLFFAVQLVRILVVKVIAGLFSADVLPVRIINRVLGAALMVAAVLLLVLLAFAIVAVFGETQGVIDFGRRNRRYFPRHAVRP